MGRRWGPSSRPVRQHERQAPALLLAWVKIRYGIRQVGLAWRDALFREVGKLRDLVLKHGVDGLFLQDLRSGCWRFAVVEQHREDLCHACQDLDRLSSVNVLTTVLLGLCETACASTVDTSVNVRLIRDY